MTVESAETKPSTDTPPEDEQPGAKFNPNAYDWPAHLKRALEDLKLKGLSVRRAQDYYDGKHPKVWLTDAIREQLDDELVTNMAENWCDTAVDAPVKRLQVEGFTAPLAGGEEGEENNADSDMAQNVWDDNDMELTQKELWTDSRALGDSFLGAWKDDDMEHGYRLSVMKTENIWWPEETHTAKPIRVVQVWADIDDGVWRATMYYKYVVVRLVGPKLRDGGDQMFPQARYFSPDPDDSGGLHGFEYPPVFRFARYRKRISLIDQIRTLQDKINKLAANLLVNAEFNAWRKMVLLSQQTVDDGTLVFRPNRIPVLDPGGGEDGGAATSIWESAATELSNYSNEQDKLIDKLFTKACLPGHLKIKAEREVPSGAAYEADEGPFTEDIIDQQKAYALTIGKLFEVILDIKVEPQWRNPHIKSDKDEMETVKIAVDAGMPLELALKKYAGWTKDELEELAEAPLSVGEQMQMAITQEAINGGMNPDGSPQQPDAKPKQPGKPPVVKPPSTGNFAGR